MTTVLPHVRRIEAGPCQHFLMQENLLRLVGIRAGLDSDIEGALVAGQYGAAFFQARRRLCWDAGVAFVGERRIVALAGKDVSGVFDKRVCELLSEDGTEIGQQAWRLLCLNPTTPAEVRVYVDECRRVGDAIVRLSLRQPDNVPTEHDPEGASERARQIGSVLDDLGVVSTLRAVHRNGYIFKKNAGQHGRR